MVALFLYVVNIKDDVPGVPLGLARELEPSHPQSEAVAPHEAFYESPTTMALRHRVRTVLFVG